MTADEFDRLCGLARLALSPQEKDRLRSQMQAILAYVEKLQAADVSGAEPLAHPSGLLGEGRSDAVQQSLPPSEALSQAPKRIWDYLAIPQVMED